MGALIGVSSPGGASARGGALVRRAPQDGQKGLPETTGSWHSGHVMNGVEPPLVGGFQHPDPPASLAGVCGRVLGRDPIEVTLGLSSSKPGCRTEGRIVLSSCRIRAIAEESNREPPSWRVTSSMASEMARQASSNSTSHSLASSSAASRAHSWRSAAPEKAVQISIGV